jgi:hypothetical protein
MHVTRVRSVQIGLAFLIVLVLFFSGLRAAQALSESRAQTSYDAARSSAHAALKAALHGGVSTSALSHSIATLQALDSTPRPQTDVLWDAAGAAFFNRQARAYRSVRGGVEVIVRRTTQQARTAAGRTLAQLGSQVAQARSLDVPADVPASALAKGRAQLSHLSHQGTRATPSAYRHLSHSMAAPLKQLSAAVRARSAYVHSLTSSLGNSLSAIEGKADSEASASSARLQLLALVTPRAAGYQTQVRTLLAVVHAQKSAGAAAVKEADLHDAVTQADQAFTKNMPAKMVVVSTENQSAVMYQNGQEVYSTPVTTGGPELPTDHGVFHIYAKFPDFTFHSPWPPGSPYYYLPSFVQYWMPFDGGEGLHDASWRSNFGPGSNLEPTDLGTGNYILGTHGCVNLPTPAAAWLWDWAPVGTTVVVI